MQRFLEIEEQSPVPVETGDTRRFVRRIKADRSQSWRRSVQLIFLSLNVWIGVQFVLFVRHFQSGGKSPHISRPPGVEGWLPISGLMNLKYFLATGSIPSIHPAAMFLLIAFLLISILFRKAFCGWLCPIGLISEALWKLGKKLMKRDWKLPRVVDLLLRSLKYLLLGLFIYAVGGMSAAAIEAFQSSPYGLVADIKMLHFFEFLTGTAAITIAALVVLSIFFQNFWCRYLCPYGALVGLASIFSPTKVARNTEHCIDCGKCTRACPALLPVDRLVVVRSAECTGCMECVAVCPAEGALEMFFGRKHRLSPLIFAAGLTVIFLGITGYAKWKDTWGSNIPDSAYEQLIPQLDSLQHP
jgi:polyferredoxin